MNLRLILLASLALLLPASLAHAQRAADRRPATVSPTPESSLSEVKPTPEMWLYLQERQRRDTPKLVVRRNAELAAAQRTERLAIKRWFGQSSQRPSVYATPFGAYYPGTFPYDDSDRWNFYQSVRRDGSQPVMR